MKSLALLLIGLTAFPAAEAAVRITEIMANPADAGGMPDATHEFVEIYNDSAGPVNLQNWTLGTTLIFPATLTVASLVVPPNSYLVLGNTSLAAFNAAYNTTLTPASYIDMGGTLPLLGNAMDTLTLRDAGFATMVELSYASGSGGWPTNTEGDSLTFGLNPASATGAQFADPAMWLNQPPPSVDAAAIRNDAGHHDSPGVAPQITSTLANWDGGGGADNRWSTAANWTGDAVPPPTATVIFGSGLTGSSVDMDGNRTAQSMVVDTPNLFSLGNGTLTLVSGSLRIAPNGSALKVVNAPLVLGAAAGVLQVDEAQTLYLTSGLTSAGSLTKSGTGTLLLGATASCDGTVTVSTGSLDLQGLVFTAGSFALSGSIADSGTEGALRSAGTVVNNGATFVSGPSLIMAPATEATTTALQGQQFTGLGRFVKQGPGSTAMHTRVTCQHFDLESGALDLFGGPTLEVSGSARLRAGATLYDISAGGARMVLVGHAQLIHEGATMFSDPSIEVSNNAGQTVTLAGTAPLTGLLQFVKSGAGTVRLDGIDVSAQMVGLSGLTDLNGRILTATASGGTTGLFGTLTDSGTGGTLRVAGHLQNNGTTFTSEPTIAMRPAAGDQIINIQGNIINGLGTLLIENAGSVVLRTQVNTMDFDLAGGSLDLFGGSTLRVSSTARLRAGATLYDISAGGGRMVLLGNAQLIHEGATMFSDPSIEVSNNAGQTVSLTGTAPLTGLLQFIKIGGGGVTLGIDVSAQIVGLSGITDLSGRTLTATASGGTTGLFGTLTDSGTGGTLRVAGHLQNNGTTFTSEPTIAMRPAAGDQIINIQGNIINGLGTLLIENAGSVVLRTQVNTMDFDLAGGSLDLFGSPTLRVSGTARLRAGATLYDISAGGGRMVLLGNAQLIHEGATMFSDPSIEVSNNAGQNVSLTGTAPLTGLLQFVKIGGGGVTLGIDVSAQIVGLSGITDLNGRTITATASGATTGLFGTLTDSGTGGTLRVAGHLQNNGTTFTSEPTIALRPAAGDQITNIQGNIINGLGTLLVENAGSVVLRTQVNAMHFDLAGGSLDLFGSPTLRVSGTVRLRADATLYDISAGGGRMMLLGNAQLIHEGATMFSDPILEISNDAGQNVSLTGTAPLAGLLQFVKSGAGTVTFDGIDVSAQLVGLSGITDLNGRTLNATASGGMTSLFGTLTDSGTGGTLRTAGNLQNNGTIFTSEPSLAFTPGFFVFSNYSGQPITGLGRLTIAGDPAGVVTGGTSLVAREFDLVSGTFSLNNLSSPTISGAAWLRSGAYLFSGGGSNGTLVVSGNGQLHQQGAIMDNSPNFLFDPAAGQIAAIDGPLPLIGAGSIRKSGSGVLQLHTVVEASHMRIETGILDLGGQAHVFRGSPGGLDPESLSLGAATVLRDAPGGGSVSVAYGLRNAGAVVENMPGLVIDPPMLVDAVITGEPIAGFGLVRKLGDGTLLQFADVVATRLEILGGIWAPQSNAITLDSGVLVDGGRITRLNGTLEGTLALTGGDLEITGAGSAVEVSQLRLAPAAGTVRLMGAGDPSALRAIKSGAGTFDLNGHTLHTLGEFILEEGVVRESSSGGAGQILYPQVPAMTARFIMRGGDLEALVEGSPDWSKEGVGTTTVIRGHLENCGDNFQINGGTLRLELDPPEEFNVGDMSVSPTGTLSGRGRLYDGSVFVDHGGRLRPDAMPGAFSIGYLRLETESVLEVPLIADGAPILIPPGDFLRLPDVGPDTCVLVQVTGAPVNGTTYNLLDWTGADTDAPPLLSQFQLLNSPPGFLKLNAAADTLQFVATATGGWDAWCAARFTPAELADPSISGPLADPDRDGMANRMEYVLGALPKTADAAGRIDSSVTMFNDLEVLACAFTVSRTASDVRIEPETSTDLTTWTPAFLDAVRKTATTIDYLAWTPRTGHRRQFRVLFGR